VGYEPDSRLLEPIRSAADARHASLSRTSSADDDGRRRDHVIATYLPMLELLRLVQ
jgi:hypothetical protein